MQKALRLITFALSIEAAESLHMGAPRDQIAAGMGSSV